MRDHGELIGSQFIHVMLPTVIVLIIVGVSLSVDISSNNNTFWFQRSGALMGASGIYIAFHESGQRFTGEGGTLNIETNIWYRWLALVLGIIGTLIWAYGDLPFK